MTTASATDRWLSRKRILCERSCKHLLTSFILLLPLVPVLLFLKKKLGRSKQKKLPPGPPKLPIIGNLQQIGTSPHRSLRQLSDKYGPAMMLHLGRIHCLVVSSAEAAKDVMKTHDLDCCSRPLSAGSRKLSYNYRDIAFAPYGDYWRTMRKICVLAKGLVRAQLKADRYVLTELWPNCLPSHLLRVLATTTGGLEKDKESVFDTKKESNTCCNSIIGTFRYFPNTKYILMH